MLDVALAIAMAVLAAPQTALTTYTVKGWSLFPPNGDLVLPVNGIGGDLALVNPTGQTFMRVTVAPNDFIADMELSYRDGKVTATVHGSMGTTSQVIDVSRYL